MIGRPRLAWRHRTRWGLALVALSIPAALTVGAPDPEGDIAPRLLAGTPNGNSSHMAVVNNGICDVDGVSVSYDSRYSQGPVPGYKVVAARVAGLDAHCSGATVTLVLSNGTVAVAGDPQDEMLYNPSHNEGYAAAEFSPAEAPLASWVNLVSITLSGGTLPIPVECTMNLERSFLGTTGSDAVASLTGTNQNDVLFGLEGNDTYDALNGDDCVKTGNGNNTVRMGAGADVVVAGNGNNTLTFTNGAGNEGDRIVLGDGNNLLTTGNNGGNRVTAGTGSNTITMGNGGNDVRVKGSSGSLTKVTFGNGTNTVVVGAGTSEIRLGGGDRSRVTLGAGNDHIYIGGGKNNVVDVSGGFDVCHLAANLWSKNDLTGCDSKVTS